MKEDSLLNSILRIITPLVYLIFWYMIPVIVFGKENVDIKTLTLLALPVIFIGVISRQTSWSIGGDKGIKADNIGRKARATIDRKGSFEFEGIEMTEKKVEAIIKSVKNNPIFTDKQRQEG
jgi:hypothetical protein